MGFYKEMKAFLSFWEDTEAEKFWEKVIVLHGEFWEEAQYGSDLDDWDEGWVPAGRDWDWAFPRAWDSPDPGNDSYGFNFTSYLDDNENEVDKVIFYASAEVSEKNHGSKNIELLWKVGKTGLDPITVHFCSAFPGINMDKFAVSICGTRLVNSMITKDVDPRLCTSELHSHLTFQVSPREVLLAPWKAQLKRNPVQVSGAPYFRFSITGTAPMLNSGQKALQQHLEGMKNCLELIPYDYKLNGVSCHKFILKGRSTVFNRMLEDGMVEEERSEAIIKMESGAPVSGEAVELMLKFLYFCEFKELEHGNMKMKLLNELIQVAHLYDIPSLFDVALTALRTNSEGFTFVDPPVMLELFDFALNVGLEYLKLTVVDLFVRAKDMDLAVIDQCFEVDALATGRLLREVVRSPKFDFSPDRTRAQIQHSENDALEDL